MSQQYLFLPRSIVIEVKKQKPVYFYYHYHHHYYYYCYYYYYYYYYFKQSSFPLGFLYFRTNKTLSRTIALLATTFPFPLPP